MQIKIRHQEDRKEYIFSVKDSNNLAPAEINKICLQMGVKALFVNGKYYNIQNDYFFLIHKRKINMCSVNLLNIVSRYVFI